MPYERFHQTKEHKGPTRAAVNRSNMPGWVDLTTPYNEDFVRDLKDSIQSSHRKWEPIGKVWQVNQIYLDKVVPLLKKYFDEVTTDLLQEEPVSSNLFRPVFDVLKGLPNGNLDRIYRSLAMACHPDQGGSEELMTKLNSAYDEVKK